MDYSYFEALTEPEGQQHLDEFLRESEAALPAEWAQRADAEGPAAAAPFFAEMAELVDVVNVQPPPDTPRFIIDAMEREHGGFLDFRSDEDRRRVLLAAFFLGESFARHFSSLSWSLGREHRAEVRQPVITGFRTDADLPVLEVAENLLLRYDPGAVATAIRTWSDVV